jgi:CheY-like chemotaxis protein
LDEEGKVYALGGVSTDISDRKRLEESLHQQAEALVQANTFKDEFLAVVSHELRTPLNAILGWALLLKTRQFDANKIAEALDTIERNARAQNQLISDLLDISGLIHGKTRLNLRPFDLVPILNGALRTLRPAAEAKNIQLVAQLAPNVGTILGDPERMQQVMVNLLSNAIKFTPQGGRVEVRLVTVGSWMQLQVKDSGIGIAPEFLPHVFERFRQAERPNSGQKGSLGLGLAIVRQLVEMHGGTVVASSEGEGMGATFTVQLPLPGAIQRLALSAPPKDTLPAGRSPLALPPQGRTPDDGELNEADTNPFLSGLHILVVDDEPDACDMMAMMLEPYGATVTTARSAAEARMQFRQRIPDVLISDIGMPEENGLMLIRQIRTLEQQYGGHTPAIALSAYVREEEQRQAIQSGFQSHLSKPVDEMALVNLVAQLTGRSGLESVSESDQGNAYALPSP